MNKLDVLSLTVKNKIENTAKKNIIVKLVSHPMGIYLVWLMALLLFCFTGIPLLSIGHSDGEQRPLILLGYTLDAAAVGLIIISLISPMLNLGWYKKYMFIPLVILIVIIGILVYWIINIYLSNGHHFAL